MDPIDTAQPCMFPLAYGFLQEARFLEELPEELQPLRQVLRADVVVVDRLLRRGERVAGPVNPQPGESSAQRGPCTETIPSRVLV